MQGCVQHLIEIASTAAVVNLWHTGTTIHTLSQCVTVLLTQLSVCRKFVSWTVQKEKVDPLPSATSGKWLVPCYCHLTKMSLRTTCPFAKNQLPSALLFDYDWMAGRR